MSDFIKKLLSDGLGSLILAAGVTALTLGLYFLLLYSRVDAWYEDQNWAGCVQAYVDCLQRDQQAGQPFAVSIRANKYLADFTESEIKVTVTNLTNTVQTAVLGMNLVNPNPDQVRVYLKLQGDDPNQDTATLTDLAPNAAVTVVFLVRVSGGQPGQRFPLEFRLNGQPVTHFLNLWMEWRQAEVLQTWLAKNLLLPPGTNIAAPVVGLLLARILEKLLFGLRKKWTERWRSALQRFWRLSRLRNWLGV